MTSVSWTPREPPLVPAAVLAVGPVVALLAASALRRLDAGADLDVAVGDGHLLVVGAEADLPWADGATWLGRDGPLLVPTTLAVGPDRDLVARAVVRLLGGHPGLVALAPGTVAAGPRPLGPTDRCALAELAS